MRTSELRLNEAIESAVEQIVAASHAAAVAAVDRAFGRTNPPGSRATAAISRRRSNAPRRTQDEIAELAQRFLEVAREAPGETMAVLAPRLGVPSTRLQIPIAHLKKEGQIKTTGQRHFKRYFPVEDTETETAG